MRAPESWTLADSIRFPKVEEASESRSALRSVAAGDGAGDDAVAALALELSSYGAGERHPVRYEPFVDSRFTDGEAGVADEGEGTLRGTCVVVPGVLGSGSAAHIVGPLAREGWAVAVVWPPLVDRVIEAMREGRELSREELGAAVAREVDRTVLDAARVAQLELRWLHARHPELAAKPVLLVGESMGAIAGVGMAASGEVPFDAALFVAGGGGFLDVAASTPIRPVLFGDLPIADGAFVRGFAATSRYDPLVAARSLATAPVAVLTARIDFIVPTACQESLRQALGKPPRFVFERGHIELFTMGGAHVMPVVRELAARVGDRSMAAAALSATAPSP
ncbi:MAG: hypothetical protein ACKOYN_02280 [Planctomycetota bacterium]